MKESPELLAQENITMRWLTILQKQRLLTSILAPHHHDHILMLFKVVSSKEHQDSMMMVLDSTLVLKDSRSLKRGNKEFLKQLDQVNMIMRELML